VARTLRSFLPNARTVLELGSGTGRHGRLLAEMGFHVHGIERSADMAAIAQKATFDSYNGSGSFSCEQGDICKLKLDGVFDAVISLFHVISYQTSDHALRATFRTAAVHLVPNGLFLFDVWHGPAVLSQQPAERIKEVADERFRVKRIARPEFREKNIVTILYEMECEDRRLGTTDHFSEEHHMRYLFPAEVEAFAEEFEFRRVRAAELVTEAAPSSATWGVMYSLQK
jgi:SAM-dependent methyltransferase